MSRDLLAGVDIGGTKTAVVLSLVPPQTLSRLAFPTLPQNGPQYAIDRIIDSLGRLLAEHRLSATDLSAIGISCGGPLDSERGIIQGPPNLSTWIDVPICNILQSRFGAACFLENDANAGALAEHRFGAGQGMKNLVFLTMGTGLGAGLILNGKLYRGASESAGEIGHVRLTQTGPVGFGKAGTVEGWASGGGMVQVAQMFVQAARRRGEATLLAGAAGERGAAMTARDIAEAAGKGDRVAKAVIKKAGQKLGEALAILVDVLNPDCIVVGGLVLRLGEDILGPARKRMRREALPAAAQACKVIPAGLGEHIGDVAALCIAMDGLARREAHPQAQM